MTSYIIIFCRNNFFTSVIYQTYFAIIHYLKEGSQQATSAIQRENICYFIISGRDNLLSIDIQKFFLSFVTSYEIIIFKIIYIIINRFYYCFVCS